MSRDVDHFGSCHCGKIRWKVSAPAVLNCIKCNCSVCRKKQNDHFIVAKSRFKLIEGEEFLSTYAFNTNKAQHQFCKICGVQSFYTPRSNPNDIAVMPHCIDSDTVERLDFTTFDGNNWEQEIESKQPVALE